jgi:hypothetical protein
VSDLIRLGSLEERMRVVEYQLNGNGDPGLCAKVGTIYDWVQKQMGKGEGTEEDQALTALKISKRGNLIQIGLVILTALSIITAICSIYVAHKESSRSSATPPGISMPQNAGSSEMPNQ